MNGLLEILTNKYWMMAPDQLHAIRAVLESNLNARVNPGTFVKRPSFAASASGGAILNYAQMEDGAYCSSFEADEIDEPFVNVIVIDGPVTRNGGACSYGSYEHRDMIMMAADNPFCCGHVIFIDTPGGSAWAVNDYKQAIEYAKSKGQHVYAFIDGMCASAGMYVAAMCDKRFYMHPKDEVGCIGTMAAFYTEKDGERNEYTNETYHEVYDPESFDKNKWYRDAANDGDTKELVDTLAELGAEFRDCVTSRCPKAKDEHIHGKTFAAEDVKGILVDEQSTLNEVIQLCFNEGSAHIPVQNNSKTTMTEKYPNVAAACGAAELVVEADGAFMATEMLDNLSAHLDSLDQQIKDAQAQLTAQAEAFETKENEMAEAHSSEIAAVRSECSEKLSAMTLEKEEAEAQLAELRVSLADKEATIEALTKQSAETPDESPACNGTGVQVQTIITMPAYDSNLSPEENERIRNEWKRKYNL